MSSTLFFAVGTIGQSKRAGRKPSTLLGAARHNQRAIQAERGGRSHIDVARSHLNETIAGPDTPEEVVALALALMTAAGVKVDKLRKDYTQAVELLFSLPPDTTIDTGEYFHRCLAWAGERFGKLNILSACIHRDEAAPHCHILILPLVDGRVRGSSLITRPALKELCKSFGGEVAHGFGLKEPPGRMSGVEHGRLARMVLEKLESTQDAILQSCLWLTVRRDIEREPARFIAALGIEFEADKPTTKKPRRTMVQIFTSPGKGAKHEKPIGFDIPSKAGAKNSVIQSRLKPIGFDHEANNHDQEQRNLSCVGFAEECDVSNAPNSCGVVSPAMPKDALSDSFTELLPRTVNDSYRDSLSELAGQAGDGLTRERDDSNDAGSWCEELGEFIQAPSSNPTHTQPLRRPHQPGSCLEIAPLGGGQPFLNSSHAVKGAIAPAGVQAVATAGCNAN